tara:strand:+ start:544 stop:1092 length:549 start_codon:yes stop_codon:yes gene_type:complete
MPKQPTTLPQWQSPNIEPKRKFKFLLTFGDVPAWVIKSAGRPQITITDGATHQFLAHEFKFPGRVQYNDITITLVDPIDPDVASIMFKIIQDAGYVLPSNWTVDNEGWKQSLSKLGSIDAAKGNIAIKTVDSNGNDVEKWTLHNAWLKDVNYDDVDYSSEELMTITVTLRYDYASQEIFSNE